MDPKSIKDWIDVAQGIFTLFATLLVGFWAWIRLVLERGLLPPSQMDIALRNLGSTEQATLVEIGVNILNKGSSALVVTDLRIRLRYLNADDDIELIDDPARSAFGRIHFTRAHSLARRDSDKEPKTTGQPKTEYGSLTGGEFLVVPYDTFVQPGVSQSYTFATALPCNAKYLLARASFRYQLRPSGAQLALLVLGRRLGLMQYSLHHIREPHTSEKSFNLRDHLAAVERV